MSFKIDIRFKGKHIQIFIFSIRSHITSNIKNKSYNSILFSKLCQLYCFYPRCINCLFLSYFQAKSAMVIFILLLIYDSVESLTLKNVDKGKNEIVFNPTSEPLVWEHREEDNTYFPVVSNGLFEIQSRVAFSTEAPILPPSEGNKRRTKRDSSSENSVERKRKQRRSRKNKRRKNRKNKKQNKKRRHNHGLKKSRRRRSNTMGINDNYDPHPLSVCDSVSDWVQLNESVTDYGLQVQVLSHRWSGDQRLKQYIYETKCAHAGGECRGIDTENYRSECVTKKIYIDAFVRDEHGDEMWTKIEVNGSCNCKLFRKRLGERISIFDHWRGL